MDSYLKFQHLRVNQLFKMLKKTYGGIDSPPPPPPHNNVGGLNAVSTTKQFLLQPFSQGNVYFKLVLNSITKMCLLFLATCYHARLDNPAPLQFILRHPSFNYSCHLQIAVLQKQKESHNKTELEASNELICKM